MKQSSWVACAVVFGFTLQLSTNVVAAPRVWTSADEKFTIKAELIDYSDEDVRLKKEDGSTVTVKHEHLIEKDLQFVRDSPLSIYRMDGVLQVRNPRANMGWFDHSQVNDENGTHIVVQSGTDMLKGYMQLLAYQLPEESHPKTVNDQFFFAMGALGTTIHTLAENGVFPVDFNPPMNPADDASKPLIINATMMREDGASIELRHQTIFGKRYAFTLLALAKDKKEADKLLEVIKTVKELEETQEDGEEK